MSAASPNFRKAAVLIRSLDAESAACLLAQLSAEEADALREAALALGPIDPEERADVVAEFRRAAPIASRPAAEGVELSITARDNTLSTASTVPPATKRFEFLDKAPINALAPYLAREHAQTIALVLSHLPPARAALVLAALPQKIQANTIERLARLGDSDPESVVVVERELADWVAKRSIGTIGNQRRSDPVTSILAAADPATRNKLFANLKTHKATLARELAASEPMQPVVRPRRPASKAAPTEEAVIQRNLPGHRPHRRLTRTPQPTRPMSPPLPSLSFDELIHFDDQTLVGLLREADPNVLALALAGSREELIDRICSQMPKRVARGFRRRLRRMGPTRLSDVEAAQQTMARIAAQRLSEQRTKTLVSAV